jgi:hypothetical protein
MLRTDFKSKEIVKSDQQGNIVISWIKGFIIYIHYVDSM